MRVIDPSDERALGRLLENDVDRETKLVARSREDLRTTVLVGSPAS